MNSLGVRIALMSHEPLYPPTGGGSSEAGYIVRELVRRGHKVSFFGPVDSAFNKDALEERFAIDVIPFTSFVMGRYTKFRTLKYLLYPVFLLAQFESVARHRKFDLILSQHSISAVAAGIAGQRSGIPVIMNFLDFLTGFMDSWPAYMMPPPLLYLLKKYELSIPRRYAASGVLCVSQELVNRFQSAGFSDRRIHAIQFGFDRTAFPFSGKNKLPLGPGSGERRIRLVMHGSMDAHHLGPILYEALEYLSALPCRERITLQFIGKVTPTLSHFIQRARKNSPGIAMETLGFVEYEKIHEILGGSDIGLVPYEVNDGAHCAFVAKAVEYAAVGIPVVSTRLAGISDYFRGEEAIAFTNFNGESFGKAIVRFIDDYPQPSTMENLSRKVHGELGWDSVVDNAVTHIESFVPPAG